MKHLYELGDSNNREELMYVENKIKKYPKDLGFFMPAEWQSHQQTWMMWPTGLDPAPGHGEAVPGQDIQRRLDEGERLPRGAGHSRDSGRSPRLQPSSKSHRRFGRRFASGCRQADEEARRESASGHGERRSDRDPD